MAASTKRVLIVDDEPAICAMLSAQLGGKYTVETVPNGSQAFGAILRQRPDVIVLDINLPGLDGVHLLTTLREVAAGIPVVVITGYDNPAMADAALRSGAYAYLPKPFDLRRFDAVVEAALSGLPNP